ncbi:hypothetical protein MWU49_09560 [Alcanivorax sp. S6407]|uniref:hypothetical protein n=1 Tax=Alcanivorax sp. S6407 TaxID=2926424 RepID=UPI001FF6BAAA|nr:hypothetical protein [Alcanivorax sp. S6407]MCK0153949.1 hypothetical protein [Alcanivorax sp. S6407]
MAAPAGIWTETAQQENILVGNDGNTRFMIIYDPNCPYSAIHYTRLKKLIPEFSARWVAVSYYKNNSNARTRAIIEADDPAEALDKNFSSYDYEHQQGAWPIAEQNDVITVNQKEFKARWQSWAGATPITLVRSKGGTTRMFFGAVHNQDKQEAFLEFVDNNLK